MNYVIQKLIIYLKKKTFKLHILETNLILKILLDCIKTNYAI